MLKSNLWGIEGWKQLWLTQGSVLDVQNLFFPHRPGKLGKRPFSRYFPGKTSFTWEKLGYTFLVRLKFMIFQTNLNIFQTFPIYIDVLLSNHKHHSLWSKVWNPSLGLSCKQMMRKSVWVSSQPSFQSQINEFIFHTLADFSHLFSLIKTPLMFSGI